MRVIQHKDSVISEKVSTGNVVIKHTNVSALGRTVFRASFISTVICVSRSLILSLSVVRPYGPVSVLSIHCLQWLLTAEPWQRAYICEVKPTARTSKGPRCERRPRPQITSSRADRGVDCRWVAFWMSHHRVLSSALCPRFCQIRWWQEER